MRLPLAFLALSAFAVTAQASVWGDDSTHATRDDKPSMAICQKTKGTSLPTPPSAPANCDASALYYGTGQVANPAAARACASAHPDTSDPLGGRALLATIYANGRGAARDLDLAIAYACRMDGAPAEMDARIARLVKLKANGPGAAPFDICDDVTSGVMTTACTRRDAERATAQRDAALAMIGNKLNVGNKAAFAKLLGLERSYAKSVGEQETDKTGTMGPARVIGAEEAQNETFMTILQTTMAGRAPRDAAASLADADSSLAAAYDKLMGLTDMSDLGSVEKKGISATQQAWLMYRDAFVAFAKAAAPGGAAAAAKTQLTIQRGKDLNALLG